MHNLIMETGWKTKKFVVILFFAGIFLSSCDYGHSTTLPPTISPASVMTLAASTAHVKLTEIAPAPSATPSPTQTAILVTKQASLPTSIPAIYPIKGQINKKTGVYSLPVYNAGYQIGRFSIGQTIKVTARDETAGWLYIIFTKSPTGTAWVRTDTVNLFTDLGRLPVVIFPDGYDSAPILLPPFLYQMAGSPAPPGTPAADWPYFGKMTQPVNVRIGPSAGFLSIGTLKQGVLVTIKGRTTDNVWVMIDYPSGPQGCAWILSSFVEASTDFTTLPGYNVLGTPVVSSP